MIHANTFQNIDIRYLNGIYENLYTAIDNEIEKIKKNLDIKISDNRRYIDFGIRFESNDPIYIYLNKGIDIDYSKVIAEYQNNGWYDVSIQYVYSFIKRNFKTHGFSAIYKHFVPEKVLYVKMFLDNNKEQSNRNNNHSSIGSGNF